jgi:hypothetical protein
MSDFLEMDTDTAGRVFDLIAAAGHDLAAGWEAAMARVEAGEAAIGNDRLAAAFTSRYTTPSDKTRTLGGTMPARLASDADAGHGSAAEYLTAGTRAAALFQNLA